MPPEQREEWKQRTLGKGRDHIKVGFDRFAHGIIKRRLVEGENEEDEYWKTGHPILFPNVLRVGGNRLHQFQFRVPIHDVNTYHLCYLADVPESGEVAPHQDEVPYWYRPLNGPDGRIDDRWVVGQDQLAWVIQGR